VLRLRAFPACNANSAALWDRTIGPGDQLEQVPVGIVEIDAAAAIEMVDFARMLAAEIGVMLDAVGANTGEGGIEFLLADQEGIVLRAEALGVRKIEGNAVFGLDRYEVSPFRPCLQV
jgi:hypothetical protein